MEREECREALGMIGIWLEEIGYKRVTNVLDHKNTPSTFYPSWEHISIVTGTFVSLSIFLFPELEITPNKKARNIGYQICIKRYRDDPSQMHTLNLIDPNCFEDLRLRFSL